jgi:hypothetical protein
LLTPKDRPTGGAEILEDSTRGTSEVLVMPIDESSLGEVSLGVISLLLPNIREDSFGKPVGTGN